MIHLIIDYRALGCFGTKGGWEITENHLLNRQERSTEDLVYFGNLSRRSNATSLAHFLAV
jgi:hypothetical protein